MVGSLLLLILWTSFGLATTPGKNPSPPGEFYGYEGEAGNSEQGQQSFANNVTVRWQFRGGATLNLSIASQLSDEYFMMSSDDPRHLEVNASFLPEISDQELERGSKHSTREARRFVMQEAFVYRVQFNATNATQGSFSFGIWVPQQVARGLIWAQVDEESGDVELISTEYTEEGILLATTTLESGTFIIVREEEAGGIPFWTWILIIGGIIVLGSLVIILSKEDYREMVRRRFFGKRVAVHRLSIDEVLDNENRSNIIDLVLDHPGIHFNQLREETGLTPGVLTWHTSILEKYGVIKKEETGQYLVFLPVMPENPIDLESVKLLKSETTLEVLQLVQTQPGLIQTEIADKLSKDPKTIKYHLDKLLEKGFIRVEVEGRRKFIYPTGKMVEPIVPEGGVE